MSNIPEYDKVILDTRELITELDVSLSLLNYACVSINEIMELIFTSIMYEKRAKEELACACAELLKNSLGPYINIEDLNRIRIPKVVDEYGGDLTMMANIIYQLGDKINDELVRMKAYRNGYLFYQFLKMIDKDIVLEKFIPPTIPEQIPD